MGYVFIGLFLISIYFKWFKGKYTNNNKIYTYNDTIYIDDFDIKYVKINKRESRAGIDICYI